MGNIETYRARSNRELSAVRNVSSPFTIVVRLIAGLTERQKTAFKRAADRWCRIIVGDLPRVEIDNEIVDDVLILAEGSAIDGVGSILGQAGPTHLRPASAGKAAFLPAKGHMQFDTADLEQMELEGTIDDVIAHEMGHVLGIGTVWNHKALLRRAGTANPVFIGPSAMKEYASLRGLTQAAPVPVENMGGAGTRNSHWRETIFRNELMSGFIGSVGNPVSRVTAASLQDMGYAVDMGAADPYTLPNLFELAEQGVLNADARSAHDMGVILPRVPVVLPDESLQ